MRETVESFFMIAALAGGIVGYALLLARREDREDGSLLDDVTRYRVPMTGRQTVDRPDPDAHLGRCGTE